MTCRVDLESRRTLLGLAALAGAVSIPLWIPGVSDALYDTDPALLWAVNLPQLGFGGLLAHVLARRAADTEDTRAAAWLRVAVTGFVVVALLPILVWGAGVDALEVPAYVGATAGAAGPDLDAVLVVVACVGVRRGPLNWRNCAGMTGCPRQNLPFGAIARETSAAQATRAAPPGGGTALVGLRGGAVRRG